MNNASKRDKSLFRCYLLFQDFFSPYFAWDSPDTRALHKERGKTEKCAVQTKLRALLKSFGDLSTVPSPSRLMGERNQEDN